MRAEWNLNLDGRKGRRNFARKSRGPNWQACGVLYQVPMNQPFTNLMERYSGEAELARQQEEQAARHDRIRAAIIRYSIRFTAIALIGAGAYYYKPISANLNTVTAKVFPQKPLVSADQQAKIGVVSDAAAKRDKVLDDVMH